MLPHIGDGKNLDDLWHRQHRGSPLHNFREGKHRKCDLSNRLELTRAIGQCLLRLCELGYSRMVEACKV